MNKLFIVNSKLYDHKRELTADKGLAK